jgi:hypothetical protein
LLVMFGLEQAERLAGIKRAKRSQRALGRG